MRPSPGVEPALLAALSPALRPELLKGVDRWLAGITEEAPTEDALAPAAGVTAGERGPFLHSGARPEPPAGIGGLAGAASRGCSIGSGRTGPEQMNCVLVENPEGSGAELCQAMGDPSVDHGGLAVHITLVPVSDQSHEAHPGKGQRLLQEGGSVWNRPTAILRSLLLMGSRPGVLKPAADLGVAPPLRPQFADLLLEAIAGGEEER